MGSRPTLCRLVSLALLLAALAVIGTGCSPANKHRADEFVGTWSEVHGQNSDIMLDLKGDGLGTSRFAKYPNVDTVRWSVVGESIVLASIDGTQTFRCPYRIDSPGRMTLTVNGSQHTLLKNK